MSAEIWKVGGEVDSICTKCKLELAHTILAMVGPKIARVRCNTCMGEHAYKAPKAARTTTTTKRATKTASKTKAKASSARAEADTYESLMRGKDPASAVQYSVRGQFATGQVLSHPTFGLGVVAAVRGVGKIDVVFTGGVKTLLHNKDALPTQTQMARALPRPTEGASAAGGDS